MIYQAIMLGTKAMIGVAAFIPVIQGGLDAIMVTCIYEFLLCFADQSIVHSAV
jgi:hypothetical protein